MRRDWNHNVANLLSELHTPAMPQVLIDTIAGVVPIDSTVIAICEPGQPPIYVFDDYRPNRQAATVDSYMAGAYLLDPVYHACVEGSAAGVYCIDDVSPDEFAQSEYFKSYFSAAGLIDEAGFFVELREGVVLVISHCRYASSGCFSGQDIDTLQRIEPVVAAAAAAQWTVSGATRLVKEESVAFNQRVRRSIERFARDELTDREHQLVMLMLRGHSSKSTAKVMQISPGTAKIHRQNVYSKLGVSSHAELFAKFIDRLRAGD